MKLTNLTTYHQDEFVFQSALTIKKVIEEFTSSKNKINIALSGGSTPLPIYKKLREFDLNWDAINFFIVDERCVAHDDDQSNYKNIHEALFSHIPSKAYPLVKEEMLYDKAASDYQTLIAEMITEVDNYPQFDLMILGMGLDGHTASLFPNTQALNNKKDLVVLNQVPHLNCERITMTYPLILNSKKIILIIKGEEKKAALYNAIENDLPVAKVINKVDYILN